MKEPAKTAEAKAARSAAVGDWFAGASVGSLLGLLIGLSQSPVVSVVVTAIVALLAGLFGLSGNSPLGLSTAGLRRLTAFGLAGVIFTLGGVAARTHDWLSPTVEQQKAMARAMGYEDRTKEQAELLRYIRFGLLPAGTSAPSGPQARSSVLYSDLGPTFCADLSRVQNLSDLLLLLSSSDATRPMADQLRRLSAAQQNNAVEFSKLFLCAGR
jgi:hypothetical protein